MRAARRLPKSAVVDEAGGDRGEGQEVLGLAFVAAVESAAAGHPGHGAFNDPAVTAQPGGAFLAAAGDSGRDPTLAEPSPQVA
jgi:hypothetical protein